MFPALDQAGCYLGVVRSNQSIATLDTRVGIFPCVKFRPASPKEIAALLTPETLGGTFLSKIDEDRTITKIIPSVSAAIVDAMWNEPENRQSMSFLARALGPKTFRDGFALQQEEVDLALKFFAHQKSDPVLAVIPSEPETSLAMWLLEDTVVAHDARNQAAAGID
jgi:hypothetical protein